MYPEAALTSLSDSAGDLDRATQETDDPVRDPQTESGAPVLPRGGYIRL